jgi:hypothetical protein
MPNYAFEHDATPRPLGGLTAAASAAQRQR